MDQLRDRQRFHPRSKRIGDQPRHRRRQHDERLRNFLARRQNRQRREHHADLEVVGRPAVAEDRAPAQHDDRRR